MRTEIVKTYRTHDKYIPIFDVTDATAFVDQPNDDSLTVVSDSTSDVQDITIIYTDHVTGLVEFETLTLDGTTDVLSTSSSVGDFLGAFLGDINGTISSPAVGSITITTTGGLTPIATIATTKLSIGLVLFYLAGRNVVVENIAGNTFMNAATPTNFNKTNAENLTNPTVPSLASSTNASLQLAGRIERKLTVTDYISFISDTTGSTVQITVLA